MNDRGAPCKTRAHHPAQFDAQPVQLQAHLFISSTVFLLFSAMMAQMRNLCATIDTAAAPTYTEHSKASHPIA